jgi:DNA-binding MarR family transcriptional regulator
VTEQQAAWLAHHLRGLMATYPAALAACDVTLGQLMALHFISARAPVTLAGLGEELGTRPPATCAMVDRLTRAGLVCRTPDPADRRRTRVVVTGMAEAMIGEIDLETARHVQAVVNGMSPSARRHLGDALTETARRLAR